MTRAISLTLLILTPMILAMPARGDVPGQISYQGILVDAQGEPAAGEWTVTFTLFDDATEGDALFEETQTLTVDQGVLSVVLGASDGNAIAPDLLATGNLWLEISFDGDSGPVILTPRQQVVSHPYALHAGHADVSQQATNAAQLGGKDPAAYVEMAALDSLCIAPNDLAELLAELGFIAGPHYSDADVAEYLQEHGFSAGDSYSNDDVATYLADNGYVAGPHYTDGDVQAWLDGQGYVPGDHYTNGKVQIYLDAAGYVVGPHYSDADVATYLSEAGVVAGPHYSDGDVQAWLDGQGYVAGPHLAMDDVLAAVDDMGFLKPGEPIPPEMLPPDGLDEVSNGLLTTTFDATFASTGTPVTVPDAYLGGTSDTLLVPDVGKIQDVTISLNVQHPAAGDLKVLLTAPGGQTFLLHDHNDPIGGGIETSFDDETLPLEGDLSVLDGTYAAGEWTLELVDDQLENEGTLVSWAVHVEALSEQSVRVNGDLTVAGNFALEETPVNSTTLTTLTEGPDSPADGLHTHNDLAVFFVEDGGIWSGGGTSVPEGGNYQNIYSGAVNASDPNTAGLNFESVSVSCNHSPGWAGYVCCCVKGTIAGDNGSFTLEESCKGLTNQTVKHSWNVAPALLAESGGTLSLQGKSCGGGIKFSGVSIKGDKFLRVKRLAP